MFYLRSRLAIRTSGGLGEGDTRQKHIQQTKGPTWNLLKGKNMKIELITLCSGNIDLEIIAETEAEFALLKGCWKRKGYKYGNGQSISSKGGAGFYIPLVKAEDQLKSK